MARDSCSCSLYTRIAVAIETASQDIKRRREIVDDAGEARERAEGREAVRALPRYWRTRQSGYSRTNVELRGERPGKAVDFGCLRASGACTRPPRPNGKSQNDLERCVNDITNVYDVLVKYFGFAAADIKMLSDKRATKKAILAGLGSMVGKGKPGDTLVFHYSGHGSQVRDTEGDELEDGKDEIICPWDFDWEDGYIKDDDFHAMFQDLSILAYHLLHAVEQMLLAATDHRSWPTIRAELETHRLLNIHFRDSRGRLHQRRTATNPTPAQKEIYRTLGLDPRPLPPQRHVLDPAL